MTELAGTLTDSAADGDIRGVAAIDGILYISGRNGGSSDVHRIYVVDTETTTLLGHFPVPEPHASSSRGAYDLAVDLAGNLLAGGDEGIAVFSTTGEKKFTIRVGDPDDPGTWHDVPLPLDDDGEPVIGNQGDGLGVYGVGALTQMSVGGRRHFAGVAFNPLGDGGNGTVYVAQGLDAGDFLEVRVSDAVIVKRYEVGADSDGLAYDHNSNTLWTSSSFDFTEGFVELDLSAATDVDDDGEFDLPETGNIIPLLRPDIARTNGGIDLMKGGDRAHPWGATFDMVGVSVDDYTGDEDDFIQINRLHQFPGVQGYDESFLGGSTNANPISNVAPVLFNAEDTLNWVVTHNGRGNYGGPALNFLNFGADATIDGITDAGVLGVGLTGNFPELVTIWAFSVPAGGFSLESTTVGDAFGDFAPAPSAITSVALPVDFPVATNDTIRLQSLYFEINSPTLGFAASNELWFLGVRIKDILVELDAPSAYHVDLVNPFIRITELGNDGTSPIVKVILDVSTQGGNAHFDVDAGSMFDIFAAGNGLVYGCTGTYRNGSDVASGLIYEFTDRGLVTNSSHDRGTSTGDVVVVGNYTEGNTAIVVKTEDVDGALDLSYQNWIRFDGSSQDYSTTANISLGAGEQGILRITANRPQKPGAPSLGLTAPLLDGTTIAIRNGSKAGYPSCAPILRDSGLENVEVPLAGYRGFQWLGESTGSTSEAMRQPQQIQFDFAPDTFHGMTFGFDVDIDSVASDQGRALAGTRVEITLQDGTVLEGFTLPDDARPNRSLIGW